LPRPSAGHQTWRLNAAGAASSRLLKKSVSVVI
jgi:hypothetical protein